MACNCSKARPAHPAAQPWQLECRSSWENEHCSSNHKLLQLTCCTGGPGEGAGGQQGQQGQQQQRQAAHHKPQLGNRMGEHCHACSAQWGAGSK